MIDDEGSTWNCELLLALWTYGALNLGKISSLAMPCHIRRVSNAFWCDWTQ